jgi:hypothetical protein
MKAERRIKDMRKVFIINIIALAILVLPAVATAEIYEMDASTAADMRLLGVSPGDRGDLDYVGYNPGSPADKVFGIATEYGAGQNNMTYAVGFTGGINDDNQSGSAELVIGLERPGLSGNYDAYVLPIANDDDDVFKYRSFIVTSQGAITSNWTSGIGTGDTTTLTIDTTGIDYSDITSIGFVIQWDRSLNGNRAGDDYNTSVVPVPGAILLGLLGMSAAGMKLRRFA